MALVADMLMVVTMMLFAAIVFATLLLLRAMVNSLGSAGSVHRNAPLNIVCRYPVLLELYFLSYSAYS
jgi:hypothetical protein